MNLCDRLPPPTNGSVSLGGVDFRVPAGHEPGSPLVLGLRPEALELASDGVPARRGRRGARRRRLVFCTAELGGESTKLVARVDARSRPERGARVSLRPRAGEAHLFDAATGVWVGD